MQLWDTYPLWICIYAVQVCTWKYTKRALLNSNFINKIQCNSYSGVNNNTTLFVFVFVFVQSVSNEYCTIWSVCAASHLTLRDSEWRVNLGPACRCHTWTSPCLPSTWEPLFVFAFCIYSLYLFSTHILKSWSRKKVWWWRQTWEQCLDAL